MKKKTKLIIFIIIIIVLFFIFGGKAETGGATLTVYDIEELDSLSLGEEDVEVIFNYSQI